MDIVVKSVLEYIQSLDGHKNSILAGGAPRDTLLGLTPRDYDLCIPSKNNRQVHELAQSVTREFNIQDMVCKTREYSDKKARRLLSTKTHAERLTCVYGFTFEGKKIDLIGYREDDDEDFANEVIVNFDYGINMVYDTGSYVCDDNPDFREDIDYRSMTLINLPYMSELPKAMERYNRLSNRHKEVHGYELKFRSTCLSLSRKDEMSKIPDSYSYKTASVGVGTVSWEEGSTQPMFIATPPTTWNQAVVQVQQEPQVSWDEATDIFFNPTPEQEIQEVDEDPLF